VPARISPGLPAVIRDCIPQIMVLSSGTPPADWCIPWCTVINPAILRGFRGQQAVNNYLREITPFCVVCGKGIDHDQPAYQLNEGTTQDFTPTFIPGSSVGLLHASCFGEILEHVCQTLLPVPFKSVIPVKPRLPLLVLKNPAQVPVKTPREVPGK